MNKRAVERNLQKLTDLLKTIDAQIFGPGNKNSMNITVLLDTLIIANGLDVLKKRDYVPPGDKGISLPKDYARKSIRGYLIGVDENDQERLFATLFGKQAAEIEAVQQIVEIFGVRCQYWVLDGIDVLDYLEISEDGELIVEDFIADEDETDGDIPQPFREEMGDLPPLASHRQREAGLFEGLISCNDHGMPMVLIGQNYVCPHDHLLT